MKSHPILGKLAFQNRPCRAAHPHMTIGGSAPWATYPPSFLIISGMYENITITSTMGSALDGAVLDFTQIYVLTYLVHSMSRSQLYTCMGFGLFGWLPFFSVNNILGGLWLNCI